MPPGLGFAVLAVPAHGHQRGPTGLARLPSPLSSLSLPLTKRSPGSPGEGQEHACGRGCARSQHPRNPGTRGGPEPPLCEPTGGVTAPLDLPLGPPAPSPCTDSPPSSLWGTVLAGSHQEALPPSCSHSAIALISENSEECSSDGITWNCSFSGKTKHTKVFCVRYWAGWVKLCVGVFFFCLFPCYFVWILF